MNTTIKSTMAERLSQATTTQTVQTQTAKQDAEAEKIASDGKMLRAKLATILDISETAIPSWYLNANPHILMRMSNTDGIAANPVAQRDMRQAFEAEIARREALDIEDMANEYRAYTLLDKSGNRSPIAVAHKQSESRGAYPPIHTYRQFTGYMKMPLVAFKTAKISPWISGIGRPCALTLTEETAHIVFPDHSTRSTLSALSTEDLCESLDMCYWNRVEGVVVAVMMNGKQIKDAVALPFDKLGTTYTNVFNCNVEDGDTIKYCTQLFKDDQDGRKAVALILKGDAPRFFKYKSQLAHLFN